MSWVLQRRWKNIYIYTNLNKTNKQTNKQTKKTFSIILPTKRFKNCFHRIVGNEYFTREWLPRHAIVYIPTADFGENLWETQAKAGDLKPFAQRYFLIGSVFMVFKVIAQWKIWWCFYAIILLRHTVKFCVSVWSLFGLKTNFDLFYFSLSHTTKTWTEYKIHWKILK